MKIPGWGGGAIPINSSLYNFTVKYLIFHFQKVAGPSPDISVLDMLQKKRERAAPSMRRACVCGEKYLRSRGLHVSRKHFSHTKKIQH